LWKTKGIFWIAFFSVLTKHRVYLPLFTTKKPFQVRDTDFETVNPLWMKNGEKKRTSFLGEESKSLYIFILNISISDANIFFLSYRYYDTKMVASARDH
jgi:hypothetical protein